jgi:hypothetical protein
VQATRWPDFESQTVYLIALLHFNSMLACRCRRITAYVYRQCSGADSVAVDLIVISRGAGDWERFAVEAEAVRIVVECRANATN